MDDTFPDEHLFAISIHPPWFVDLTSYLLTRKCPNHFSHKQKRRLIRKSSRFQWITGILFKMFLDHVLRKCVAKLDVYDVVHAYHHESEGGHYSVVRTIHKILGAG